MRTAAPVARLPWCAPCPVCLCRIVQHIFRDIHEAVQQGILVTQFSLKSLPKVLQELTKLTAILVSPLLPHRKQGCSFLLYGDGGISTALVAAWGLPGSTKKREHSGLYELSFRGCAVRGCFAERGLCGG